MSNARIKGTSFVYGKQASHLPTPSIGARSKYPISRQVPCPGYMTRRKCPRCYIRLRMLRGTLYWMQHKHTPLAQAARAVHYFPRHVASQRIERCKTALNKSNAIGDGYDCEMCKILFGLFLFSWHGQSWHNRTKYKMLASISQLNIS